MADDIIEIQVAQETVFIEVTGSGLQGPPGPTGAQGVAGPQGAQGAQGAQGPTGPQGTQGPAGPQGSQGPTGPQGSQGPAGAAGAQGPQGIQGPAGSVWHSGSGVPTSGIGNVNDRYLNTADGSHYLKVSDTVWAYDGSIQGPQGPTGPEGQEGPQGIGLDGPILSSATPSITGSVAYGTMISTASGLVLCQVANTFPTTAFARIIQHGSGQVVVEAAPASGLTIRSSRTNRTRAQFSVIEILRSGSDVYLFGDLALPDDVGRFSSIFLVNSTTSNPVQMYVDGVDDNNVARGWATDLGGTPTGSNTFSEIYLKNRDTGDWVKVSIAGASDTNVSEDLNAPDTPGSVNSFDSILLLNPTTGNYIRVFAEGPNSSPAISCEPE